MKIQDNEIKVKRSEIEHLIGQIENRMESMVDDGLSESNDFEDLESVLEILNKTKETKTFTPADFCNFEWEQLLICCENFVEDHLK